MASGLDQAVRFRVRRIHEHPDYNPDTLAYDFSLLELEETVRFSDFIRPVCMPDTMRLTKKDLVNSVVQVTGWGVQTFDPVASSLSFTPSKLKMLNMNVIPSQICHEIYQKHANEQNWAAPIVPAMMCAVSTTNHSSTCFGDSGGECQHQRNFHFLCRLCVLVT